MWPELRLDHYNADTSDPVTVSFVSPIVNILYFRFIRLSPISLVVAMKALLLLLIGMFSLNGWAQSISDPLVIQNVHVLSMDDEQVRENQTIIISDGVIQWVGNAADAEIPTNAHVITGEYYVMPGLAEMHAHIPQGEQYPGQMEDVLVMYVTQGITTIRGMLGHPDHLTLRERAANGEIVSPRIFTSGPSFSANSSGDLEEIRRIVREQHDAGYDLIKLHPGLSVEQFDAIADEAHSLGMEFSGHISYDVGLERTLDAGQTTIDHLDRYMEFLAGDAALRDDPSIIFFGYDLTPHVDESLIGEAARRTVDAGVWNVPTNTLLHNVLNPDLSIEEMQQWPGMDLLSPQAATGWGNFVRQIRNGDDYDAETARRYLDIRDKLTLSLHEHGAGLLLGADAPQIFNPPGFSAHRELALLVNAGLSSFEALQTATVNVGEYLGELDSTGKILPGYRADLLLLSANPLETLPSHETIEGVIYQGEYLDSDTINTLLDGIRNRNVE